MRVLVKLGGTLLEESGPRAALCAQLAAVASKHALVVVHGGGKQVTKYLEERGVQSKFVNGLRVSDAAVIEAVTTVIAGTVNQQLVASLVAAGLRAVGLSGIDGPLTVAEQLNPNLGYVGRPVKTDGKLLEILAGAGYVPAIACVAADKTGQIFNVNADQMAVSCAADWHADMLLFLTDVPGVKGGDGAVMSRLTTNDSRALIQSGIAHGGMQAKLEAAEMAIERGVKEVVIASGREADVCARVLAGQSLGTRIHAMEEVA
ncbi:MAG TPA: acetylglutamate kinase [Bryobacteraceae bacterium]|nr:acetylglutamate kinase [Bryobacteraceae bacterium]